MITGMMTTEGFGDFVQAAKYCHGFIICVQLVILYAEIDIVLVTLSIASNHRGQHHTTHVSCTHGRVFICSQDAKYVCAWGVI